MAAKEYKIVNGLVMVPEKAARDLLSFGWGFDLADPHVLLVKEVQPDMQLEVQPAPGHSVHSQ